MKPSPNIFKFATSELSQDAVLAYWLSWADKEFSGSHPGLHQRAQKFLAKLLAPDESPPELAKLSIEVGCQWAHIDVYVIIRDARFLVIEDKTTTSEHSDQIEKYRKNAAQLTKSNEETWGPERISVAYVKTGNESIKFQPSNDKLIKLDRRDLIEILDGIQPQEDQILFQFHEHLTAWETETSSYRTDKLFKEENRELNWSWRGIEGYYRDLEQALHESGKMNSENGWHYVANAAGGFLGFYWFWKPLEDFNCSLYLQIESATRLQVRVTDCYDENGSEIKSSSEHRYQILWKLEELHKALKISDFTIAKSGRYRPGTWAGVVDVKFHGTATYLATRADGTLDFEETVSRLNQVMEFLELVSEKCKAQSAETPKVVD